AVALDERDDRVVRHVQLAVADGDLLACGNLDSRCRHWSVSLALSYVGAFKAEPALNHPICSSVIVCRHWMLTVLPPALWMTTSTGLPGVHVARRGRLPRCACARGGGG